MNRGEIKSKVEELLDLEDTSESSKLVDVFEDSLSMLEALMELEDYWDINIPITKDTKNYADLLDIIVGEL